MHLLCQITFYLRKSNKLCWPILTKAAWAASLLTIVACRSVTNFVKSASPSSDTSPVTIVNRSPKKLSCWSVFLVWAPIKAFIGAQTRKTDQQLNFLGERLTIVTGEVSELGDADLTKLVTDLQATIVNRDAAQAAFVKIGQQSLFDFLR